MIRQNDFARQWAVVESDAVSALRRVGSSGRYILGPEVEQFEKALALSWGINHAVGVGNGMDALEIALRCLGLRAGDKVLTTPLSAFATTLAILRAGGVPLFADVNNAGNIDLEQCRASLSADRSIRFLVPVHLYGNPVELEGLAALRDEFELSVVEDCAQSIGAAQHGRKAGTIGQAAATSFYPTKNLGCCGDGGAVLTDNEAIATRAKALRNYGQDSPCRHSELGLNSRLDELQAAILRDAILPHLESWTARRRDIARHYQEEIRHPEIRPFPIARESAAVWHLFPVTVTQGKRANLQEHLRSEEILTGVHYPQIIPDQPAIRSISAGVCGPVRKARYLADCELSLPIHPFLMNDEVNRVIDACNQWSS